MTSIAWQRCVVYGLRRLGDVPGNSDEMAYDVAGASDALRAPSSGTPAGVVLEQPADEFEEDGNVDESERTSVMSRRGGCDREGDNVQRLGDITRRRGIEVAASEARTSWQQRSLFSMIPSVLRRPISFPSWNDTGGSFSSYSRIYAQSVHGEASIRNQLPANDLIIIAL
uniref:Uncharacterized protein n=2 Tax=Oryza sativa subsp. japonica TaxID=39947 RepID=Q94GJ9_ORYSJ|nr:hypothetical protein [Oryza sativa Japonica Group]ABF97103.1 hypothetical protein LOC_Os03g36260 [Oryza sativa Japonica Group]